MEDFNQLVDGYIVNLVNQGITDFCNLTLKLPGVYPSVVLRSINRLNSQKLIPSKLAKSFIKQSTKKEKYVEKTDKYKFKLPVPHPLDFEWRFSDTASAYLLDRCEKLTGSIDSLIMLGTPSLFRYASERRKPNYKIHFMGDNTFVTARLEEFCLDNITRCNVFYDMPTNIIGSHLILDPPWYDEFIYTFIWTAKQFCNVGGYLLVSLPAIGTRPGIIRELENILKWTNELGLVLISKEDNVIPYSTPFFELNALHAEGIYNVPQEWRKGDLFIFRNDNNQNTKKPEFNKRNGWAEAMVGNVRFKIRVDKRREYTEFTDPSLNKIIDGDILPTVSSKDERRSKAIVWTSGNRIYHCAGPYTLFQIMQALEKSHSAEDSLVDQIKRSLTDKEIILVKATVKQIMEIVDIETKEYNYYYKI